MTAPRTWSRPQDIPVGVLFEPDFDDLVHPMAKPVLRRERHGLTDIRTGEHLELLWLEKWYGWTGFVEVIA